MTKVQEASNGHERVQSRSERLLNRVPKNSIICGPYVILLNRRQKREPADYVVITQASWAVLDIRLEMKHGIPKFFMPSPCQLRQAPDDFIGRVHDQFRNHLVVKPRK